MSDRPLRICDICGQVDDHPRHVVSLDFVAPDARPEAVQANLTAVIDADIPTADKVRIAGEVNDTSVLQRHMDCCAEQGCPDGTCDAIVADAKGATGARLIKHLTSKGA